MTAALNWDLSSSLGSPIRWHTEYRTDTLAHHLWRGISRSICTGFWCTLVCYYYIRSSQCIHFVCSSVAMAASVNPGQSHDNDKFTLKYGWNWLVPDQTKHIKRPNSVHQLCSKRFWSVCLTMGQISHGFKFPLPCLYNFSMWYVSFP